MAGESRQPAHASATLKLFVCADPATDATLSAKAAQLADALSLPLVDTSHENDVDALLTVTAHRLELRMIGGDPLTRGGHPLFADFSKVDISSNMGSRIRQPIGRAIGLKKSSDPRPNVIDGTAGWGEDSWLMAALGCRVQSAERNPVIAALLRDGLQRVSTTHTAIASRITLVESNAIDLFRRIIDGKPVQLWVESQELEPQGLEPKADSPSVNTDLLARPEIVFLDPMFPIRRKGAEGKPMKVLRQLVGDDSDASELLEAARAVATRRVVVKRPLHGEPIGNVSPAVSHKGKSVRYDVYPNV